MRLDELAEGLGVVSTPLGLGIIGATALTLKSKQGRKALRSLAVGATGLVLGVVDGAREIVEGVRKEFVDVAEEARSARSARISDVTEMGAPNA